MAWRIHENLVAGTLDNTAPGRVTGELTFIGLTQPVRLDLAGDMTGELRGKRIRLSNPAPRELGVTLAYQDSYMKGFRLRQEGEVDAVEALADGILHAAWYSVGNGRVVLELPAAAWTVEK